MKETKVYVDELPEYCDDCPCSLRDKDDCAYCNLLHKNIGYDFGKRPKHCPLQLIKDHDRELVKEVCEKISIELENETETYCEIRQCTSPHYQGDYVWFNYVKFRKFIDQIQKELEDE